MRILGYTYNADSHCIDCTKKRFANQQSPPNTLCVGRPAWARGDNKPFYESMVCHVNEHGIHEWQEDSEGNIVHPLYCIDEWQELDESFLDENPTQYLTCGDCHEIIDEYTVAVA